MSGDAGTTAAVNAAQLLWPLRPGFPGVAADAVFARLPHGAKHHLRLACRAARAAVDAHTRALDVSSNNLDALAGAAEAGRFGRLQRLAAAAQRDCEGAAAAVARALAALPGLTSLRLTVSSDGPAMLSLAGRLASLTGLRDAELSIYTGNKSCEGAVALAAALGRLPCLVRAHVDLYEVCGPSDDGPALADSIEIPESIEDLGLLKHAITALPRAAELRLPQLRAFKLSGFGRTLGGALQATLAANWASQLERLELDASVLDDSDPAQDLPALHAASLPGLRELTLVPGSGADHITAAGAAALAACSLPRLRRLSLCGLEGPEAVAAVLSAPWASHLQALTLRTRSRRGRSKDPVHALARAPLGALTSLTLGHECLTATGMAALLSADWARGLRELDLSYPPLGQNCGDDGIELLRTLARLPHLTKLTTQYARLTPADVTEHLSGTAWLPTLVEWDLLGNEELGTPEGLAALVALPLLRLRKLSIEYKCPGAEGLEALKLAKWLPGLQQVFVTKTHCRGCDLGGPSLEAAVQAEVAAGALLGRLFLDGGLEVLDLQFF